MATEQDLMLAILALDSYNEGNYSLGMTVNDGGIIGGAQVIVQLSEPSVGFYAVAYSLGDETIISYRGTTFAPDLNTAAAVYYGWTLSAGMVANSQAQLALQFYTQVTGLQAPGGQRRPISFLPAIRWAGG